MPCLSDLSLIPFGPAPPNSALAVVVLIGCYMKVVPLSRFARQPDMQKTLHPTIDDSRGRLMTLGLYHSFRSKYGQRLAAYY